MSSQGTATVHAGSTDHGIRSDLTPALTTRGGDLVDTRGDVVTLRGTNLGGWLLQEGWMSPTGEVPLDCSSWTATLAGDSPGQPRALTVDLGRATTFNTVQVPALGDLTAPVLVQASHDGANWWPVTEVTSGEPRETVYHTARFVQVSGHHELAAAPDQIRLFVADDFHLRAHLRTRFGRVEAERLLGVYQDAWIRVTDLDVIRELGMNCVRVPFDWQVVMEPDGTMRPDDEAFARLDWAVAQCARRGLYTVLDLHGVPGGAAPWHSSGHAGSNRFWHDEQAQEQVHRIWQRVASRYVGVPAVAAYDLINEPLVTMGETESPEQVGLKFAVYDRLYRAVREVDPDHVVSVAAFPGWDQAHPPTRYGWHDVLYQTHHYNFPAQHDWHGTSGFVDHELATMAWYRQEWGVPVLAGEFWLSRFDDLYDRWLGGLNELGASWTSWTYKVRNGPDSVGVDGIHNGSHWSLFHDCPHPGPDLSRDDAEQIARTWSAFSTDQFRADERLHAIYRRHAS